MWASYLHLALRGVLTSKVIYTQESYYLCKTTPHPLPRRGDGDGGAIVYLIHFLISLIHRLLSQS